MRTFIILNNKNYHHRENLEKRKVQIKKIATAALGKGGFNPKNARYRSQKGMNLNNQELFVTLTLQALPIILLAMVLIIKLFLN